MLKTPILLVICVLIAWWHDASVQCMDSMINSYHKSSLAHNRRLSRVAWTFLNEMETNLRDQNAPNVNEADLQMLAFLMDEIEINRVKATDKTPDFWYLRQGR